MATIYSGWCSIGLKEVKPTATITITIKPKETDGLTESPSSLGINPGSLTVSSLPVELQILPKRAAVLGVPRSFEESQSVLDWRPFVTRALHGTFTLQ